MEIESLLFPHHNDSPIRSPGQNGYGAGHTHKQFSPGTEDYAQETTDLFAEALEELEVELPCLQGSEMLIQIPANNSKRTHTAKIETEGKLLGKKRGGEVTLSDEDRSFFEIAQGGRKLVRDYLSSRIAFELVPKSSKVIVLDSNLHLKSAIYALFENGVEGAPLWSETVGDFVGYITGIGILRILHRILIYHGDYFNLALEQLRLSNFSEEFQTFVEVGPDTTIFSSAQNFVEKKVQLISVVDKSQLGSNIVYNITPLRIVHFLFSNKPDLLKYPVGKLSIGCFTNIVTGKHSATLYEALTLFVANNVTVLPIIDENGKLLDVWC
eukprot:TRINITY_DN3118_c0_g1_i1.p1 TRINITY_DN3118_c0_g1~~TRINITY_DN3118_c0_g1_i1.p1  ORF type:complete len:326 (+),score=54.24 TRINITY_DN3118_c0_g1_i1:295-1272(+)